MSWSPRATGASDLALYPTASPFDGPGQVRALSREVDWAATPLGPVGDWASALRAAVRLMLGAPVPTSLWVGPEYTLLYNDAYARLIGVHHPHALGRPGATVWGEAWATFEPRFAAISAGGPSDYADEACIRTSRRPTGPPEDAWFTYSLSALTDEDGLCLAVYNVAIEVTSRVLAQRALAIEHAIALSLDVAARPTMARLLAESEETLTDTEHARDEAVHTAAELTAVIESMPDATYVGGADGITLANQAALDQLGFAARPDLSRSLAALADATQTRDAAIGAPIPPERLPFARALAGEPVVQDVRVLDRATGEDRVVRCAPAPVKLEGHVIAAVAVNTDVTAATLAASERDHLAASAERARQQTETAEASERVAREHLERVIAQAPVAMYIARGRAHVFELVNEPWCRIVGKLPEEVLGRSVSEVFPELVSQGIVAMMERVYDTGEPFVTPAMHAVMDKDGDGVPEDHFFNVVYQPLRDATGAIYATALVATEVTALVEARHAAEGARSAELAQSVAEAATMPKANSWPS